MNNEIGIFFLCCNIDHKYLSKRFCFIFSIKSGIYFISILSIIFSPFPIYNINFFEFSFFHYYTISNFFLVISICSLFKGCSLLYSALLHYSQDHAIDGYRSFIIGFIFDILIFLFGWLLAIFLAYSDPNETWIVSKYLFISLLYFFINTYFLWIVYSYCIYIQEGNYGAIQNNYEHDYLNAQEMKSLDIKLVK